MLFWSLAAYLECVTFYFSPSQEDLNVIYIINMALKQRKGALPCRQPSSQFPFPFLNERSLHTGAFAVWR